MKELRYYKHDDKMPDLEFIGGRGNSCAIDLVTREEVVLKNGDFKLIPLGVSVDIPDGYKADLRMRSSTYKNFNIIQTNAVGLIDTTYRGVDDEIMIPVLCLTKSQEDIIIPKYTRIAQLEVTKSMCNEFGSVVSVLREEYGNEDSRGGFGSTGK